ncbi:MAG TPA: MFS transporter [Pseudonocardiaceae bacterium]|jgi:MFS family permease|nr:MFS transporter [Pseudonocardiaceae bacterium]
MPENQVPHPLESEVDDRSRARAALRGGVLAYFVDQFDIYLPIVTLAPATAYFQSASLSAGTSATLSALVFASTLIARPIGSAVFGHFADKLGRRRSTMVAVGGFGLTTLLIALLPGYHSIGMASVSLLIALRFIDGFFLGGEYTTAVPLAMEWSPANRRGLTSGLITCTSPAANAAISAITLILLTVLPSAGVNSAYVQWGWRIPFLVGVIMAGVLLNYYRRNVEESPSWQETRTVGGSPLAALLRGGHRRALLKVFVLMTGTWLATNMTTAVLPALLKSHVGVQSRTVTVIVMVAAATSAVSYPLLGALSQRIGRRPFYIGCGIAVAVASSIGFALEMNTSKDNIAGLVIFGIITYVIGVSMFGPVAAYLTERFPANIRATGYGVSYSLAIVIPAFYTFYLSGLSHLLPVAYGPVALFALAGVLVCVGGALGPETRDIDMRTGAQPAASQPVHS